MRYLSALGSLDSLAGLLNIVWAMLTFGLLFALADASAKNIRTIRNVFYVSVAAKIVSFFLSPCGGCE